MDLRIGTCGWGIKGGRSAYYAAFDTIELQSTFYRVPRPGRLRELKASSPDGFGFTVKAWQAITHPANSPTWRHCRLPLGIPSNFGFLRPTEENFSAWREIVRMCLAVSAEVCVVQTPPSFSGTMANAENVRRFFGSVERPFAVGWEQRGDWDPSLVRSLCAELQLLNVVDPFRRAPQAVSDMVYFRLHGIGPGEVNYRYRYTDNDLAALSELVSGFEGSVDRGYIMFNNAYMGGDALRFKRLMGGTRA